VQMRAAIARLQRRLGTTTVYVTHDQSEAMTLGDRVAVLRRGTVQQVDTPLGLYERPVNLFVGGFIGSPAMNLLPATVEGGTLRLPMVDVPLDENTAGRLGRMGRVVAGIRPEHLEDATLVGADARARGVTFRGRVEFVEWTGSELYAYLPYRAGESFSPELAELAGELDADAPGSTLVARLNAAGGAKAGRVVQVWLDAGKVHLFDPDTGQSLGRVAASAQPAPASGDRDVPEDDQRPPGGPRA